MPQHFPAISLSRLEHLFEPRRPHLWRFCENAWHFKLIPVLWNHPKRTEKGKKWARKRRTWFSTRKRPQRQLFLLTLPTLSLTARVTSSNKKTTLSLTSFILHLGNTFCCMMIFPKTRWKITPTSWKKLTCATLPLFVSKCAQQSQSSIAPFLLTMQALILIAWLTLRSRSVLLTSLPLKRKFGICGTSLLPFFAILQTMSSFAMRTITKALRVIWSLGQRLFIATSQTTLILKKRTPHLQTQRLKPQFLLLA